MHVRSQVAISSLILAFLAACSSPQSGSGPTGPLPLVGNLQPTASGDIVATVPPLSGAGVKDLGRSAPSTRVAIAVTLAYRDAAGLERLLAAQSAPGSASYHRWLTNEQFDARFAPSQADYALVARSLHKAGLTVTRTYANRTVVDAAGTVGNVEAYFATKIHDVDQNGRRARANVEPARAPSALAGKIVAVDGLTTMSFVRPQYALAHRGGAPAPDAAHSPGWPILGPPSAYSGLPGYGPRAFDKAYDLPVVHSNGKGGTYDGNGRSTAVLIDADFTDVDLATFMQYFKIARTGPGTQRVLVNGGPPPGNEAPDTIEATLDVETVVSNAPGTALYVYELPTLSDKNITDGYNKIVSDNKADVVNSSFGGCENFFASTAKAWSAIAQQGAAKGITFSASSGDYGGLLCQLAPASSPYFVAIGGTSLGVGQSGQWASEIAWGGSGGGVSAVFAEPSWQRGVPGTNNRGRDLPDVAFDANPQTGAAFYFSSWGWNSPYNPLGGTSLSSPIFVAAVTEVDQLKSGRAGLDAAKIYAIWASKGYGTAAQPYFHDVTSGGNGGYYTALGYDLVTGIGSVDVWNVASQF